MAAGAPVITSCVSALPEVAADAAVYVDPKSSAEIAGALRRLLLSESQRAELAAAGRRRAQCFRWEHTAERSLAFFHHACA
jgi:alpha-1,3-rhamnosyl/mannosyltransferase